MFDSLLNAFRAPDIRRRILVVLGLLIVFRFLAAVPVPGIDRSQLEQFLAGNPLFGLLNLFSGGGLSNFSVIALGMAERKKATKQRRRERKNVPQGHVHIQATFNNTIITITDLNGAVISWGSAGVAGFKGSRKSTPYAAALSADGAAKRAMLPRTTLGVQQLRKLKVYAGADHPHQAQRPEPLA